MRGSGIRRRRCWRSWMSCDASVLRMLVPHPRLTYSQGFHPVGVNHTEAPAQSWTPIDDRHPLTASPRMPHSGHRADNAHNVTDGRLTPPRATTRQWP